MLSALLLVSCSTSRVATEVSSSKVLVSSDRETRDSLREEISQNLNENLAEHEVVTWTFIQEPGDTVKVERVTDRTKFQVSNSKFQDSRVAVRTEVVRDTVYIEHRDTVEVQKLQGTSSSLNPHPSALNYLRWICALICAVIGLIITLKVCLRQPY